MTSGAEEYLRLRAYRHSAPQHAEIGSAILRASQRVGGRMNPAGDFGALYLSLERKTAIAELRRKARRAGVPASDLLPRVIGVVELELREVLDLRERGVRKEWGITKQELGSSSYKRCHRVARAARRSGYEAIRFPSATGSGTNLAVFLDRLRPGSRVNLVDREPLTLSD